jgi:hypothetical protein
MGLSRRAHADDRHDQGDGDAKESAFLADHGDLHSTDVPAVAV